MKTGGDGDVTIKYVTDVYAEDGTYYVSAANWSQTVDYRANSADGYPLAD